MKSAFLPARTTTLGKLFWGWYFERLLKRNFSRVLLGGENVGKGSPNVPTIYACTHGSWWDAAVTIVLSLRVFRIDAIGMMEYKQLKKYRFFSSIGMFSVVREDPRSALYSLRYAAQSIKGTKRSLWMFPQGKLVHQDLTIEAEPGIGIIARITQHVRIVPIAIRYELLRNQHPECWIRIGTPIEINDETVRDVEAVTRTVQQALTSVAEDLRADAVHERDEEYTTLLFGKKTLGT